MREGEDISSNVQRVHPMFQNPYHNLLRFFNVYTKHLDMIAYDFSKAAVALED